MFLARKGGMTFVHRGSVSACDLDESQMDLTTGWHTWNMSGIVPPGAKAVSLFIKMLDSTTISVLSLRKPGDTSTTYALRCQSDGATKLLYIQVIAGCSTTPALEYDANLDCDTIQITVLGWFV